VESLVLTLALMTVAVCATGCGSSASGENPEMSSAENRDASDAVSSNDNGASDSAASSENSSDNSSDNGAQSNSGSGDASTGSTSSVNEETKDDSVLLQKAAYVKTTDPAGLNAILVEVGDGKVTSESTDVEMDGKKLEIKAGGVYRLTGSLDDGCVVVKLDSDEEIELILDNFSAKCSDDAALRIKECATAAIVAAEGTVNTLVSGDSYSSDALDSKRDATIYSKADLIIGGGGTINVENGYKHGIAAKESLALVGASIAITAPKDGINCNENLYYDGSQMSIDAGDDAIHAENYLTVDSGRIEVTECYEGLEACYVTINDGEIFISCTDDGINASGSDTTGASDNADAFGGKMFGGFGKQGGGREMNNFKAWNSSNDETTENNRTEKFGGQGPQMPADGTVPEMNENGQGPQLPADGTAPEMNETGQRPQMPEDGTAPEMNETGQGPQLPADGTAPEMFDGQKPEFDGNMTAGMPQNASATSINAAITINGGKITIINKSGKDADGIDSNGSIYINGGEIYISVPGSGGNCAIDYASEYGGQCLISGGSVIAAGSSQMQETVRSSGDAAMISVRTNSVTSDSETVEVLDASGNAIIKTDVPVGFNNLIVSTPEIKANNTYTVIIDGKSYEANS